MADPAAPLKQIDGLLRGVLRMARLRAGAPTLDDIEELARRQRRVQRAMLAWEAAMHEHPPDERELKAFEELLHLCLFPFLRLLNMLDTIADAGPLPDGWEKTVRKALDVVQGHQELLLSFESLLHGFRPAAPEALVTSFENLLKDFKTVIEKLGRVVGRQPSKRLVERLCRRIEINGDLAASLETLMKRHDAPPRDFADSLVSVVSGQESLIGDLLKLIDRVVDNRRLVIRYENLLHGLNGLAESVADLIDVHLPDAFFPYFFEGLLTAIEDQLGAFEQIIKKAPAPDRFLLRSFENLLRECAHLLGRLEAMVQVAPDHHHIKSLERRLEVYGDLLESFQQLVTTLPRDEFVRSFQDLLERFARLIRRFREIVKHHPGDDAQKEDCKDSLAGLRDRLKGLLASLEALKGRLSPLPDDIQEANEALLAAHQQLDHEYCALLGPDEPDARGYLDSLAEGHHLLVRFAQLFDGRRRPSPRVVRRYRALVRTQADLVAEAHELVERVPAPSALLLDAAEDLDALQARVQEHARELAARGRSRP
jgi:hypothetical protein